MGVDTRNSGIGGQSVGCRSGQKIQCGPLIIGGMVRSDGRKGRSVCLSHGLHGT